MGSWLCSDKSALGEDIFQTEQWEMGGMDLETCWGGAFGRPRPPPPWEELSF